MLICSVLLSMPSVAALLWLSGSFFEVFFYECERECECEPVPVGMGEPSFFADLEAAFLRRCFLVLMLSLPAPRLVCSGEAEPLGRWDTATSGGLRCCWPLARPAVCSPPAASGSECFNRPLWCLLVFVILFAPPTLPPGPAKGRSLSVLSRLPTKRCKFVALP